MTQTAAGPDEAILALQRKAGNGAISAAFTAVRGPLLFVSDALHGLEPILPFDLWYPLQMRLITGIAELMTLEINVETAQILAESRRLQAEVAAMRAETDRSLDHKAGHPGSRPAERVRVLAEVAGGLDDDVELTDRVFLERHPERAGSPLRPEEPADADLIAEWRKIRRSIVAPVLGSELVKLLRAVGPGAKAGAAVEKGDAKPGAT